MGASEDAVSVVERTLRRRSRRVKAVRITLRVAAGGAVAAAAAALIVMSRGVGQPGREAVAPVPPAAIVAEGAAGSALPAGASPTAKERAPRALVVMPDGAQTWELIAGSRVSAGEGGPLRIASAEGTALTLDPQSTLTVVDLGQVRRFALLRGAVHARVRKLGAGERFIIDTSDAEVEVRGTAFRVVAAAPSPDCRLHSKPRRDRRRKEPVHVSTRVVVEEGVVSVRSGTHEELLYPGDSWPAPCAGVPTGARTSRPARGQAHATGPEERSRSSSLTEQNDLFSAAVAARKAGDVTRALELWERLIRDYPGSWLVEGAMAGRMRLLAATHPARAVSAAGDYLSRFPAGFARAEAVALLRAADTP